MIYFLFINSYYPTPWIRASCTTVTLTGQSLMLIASVTVVKSCKWKQLHPYIHKGHKLIDKDCQA